jgi:hypothetical protein
VRRGLLTAPTTFSKLDLTVHRVRARYGYKLTEWDALTDEQKYEELAYDHYRQHKIESMIEPFWTRIHEGESISSVEAFYALMLESI